MSTLFDTGEAPVALASPAQVRELVDRFAHRKDVVAKWTRERAAAALGRLRRDEAAGLARAAARAREQGFEVDEGAIPPVPTWGDYKLQQYRIEVSAALGQALAAGDKEQLTDALQSAVWVLTDEEVRDYAESVAGQLAANRIVPDATSESEGAA